MRDGLHGTCTPVDWERGPWHPAAMRGDDAPAGARPLLSRWRPVTAVFLVATAIAAVDLIMLASRTETYFAWTIRPALTAAFLGGGYASGFVLTLGIRRERVWVNARLALFTVWCFTAVTLVATLAHRDRFHFDADGVVAQWWAWTWMALYAVVPVWLGVLLVAQRNLDGRDPARSAPLSPVVVALLGIVGALALVVGTLLQCVPTRVSAWWPWPLTPLTGRAVGAWVLALGVVGVGCAVERDLRRLRPVLPAALAFGGLQLLVLVRFSDDVRWDEPATWVYAAASGVCAVLGAAGMRANGLGSEAGAPSC